MAQARARQPTSNTQPFERVLTIGGAIPGVESGIKYDGSPVLRLRGSFVAGLATHPSAEPDTLVVRYAIEDRESLLQDAAETYYITDYYEPYPVVLARLSRLDGEALRDLLSISSALAAAKARPAARGPARD